MAEASLPTARPNAAEHEILVQSVGVFQVAIWISLFIQGINFCLAVTYLHTYRNDHGWNKFCVIGCNVMSMVFNATICAEAWIKTVEESGDYLAIQGFAEVHGVGSLMAPSVDLLVQLWYAWRIFQISAIGAGATRSYLVPGVIVLLSLVSWGFGFACGIILLIDKGNALLFEQQFLYGIYVWQCFSGGADVFITMAFAWYMWRFRTSYTSTNNVLVKIAITVIETNMTTAILAISNAIALNRVQLGVNALLAGLLTNSYVTSMMFSLHSRGSVADSFGNRSLPAFSGTHSISGFRSKAGSSGEASSKGDQWSRKNPANENSYSNNIKLHPSPGMNAGTLPFSQAGVTGSEPGRGVRVTQVRYNTMDERPEGESTLEGLDSGKPMTRAEYEAYMAKEYAAV